ncbi:MAG: hypothetical protein ACLQNE_18040, partial [Thermoguttaceae bacterium]
RRMRGQSGLRRFNPLVIEAFRRTAAWYPEQSRLNNGFNPLVIEAFRRTGFLVEKDGRYSYTFQSSRHRGISSDKRLSHVYL